MERPSEERLSLRTDLYHYTTLKGLTQELDGIKVWLDIFENK